MRRWIIQLPNNSVSLQWRHNERDGVSNHHHLDCLPRRRSKKIPKLRVTGHCKGNPPATGWFPSQRAHNAESVFIWWRHHVAVKSRFYALNDTLLICAIKKDWAVWNMCTAKYSSSRGIRATATNKKHALYNVCYTRQMVISTETHRQTKYGEYKALPIDCFIKCEVHEI